MKNQMQTFASQTKLNKTIFSNIPGILLDHSYVITENERDREREWECRFYESIFTDIGIKICNKIKLHAEHSKIKGIRYVILLKENCKLILVKTFSQWNVRTYSAVACG